MNKPITVTQLNRYIKTMFSMEPHFKGISVSGEISNFKNHEKTGHFYFTLKDENSAIHAVMFHSFAQKVKFSPENGMKVIAKGNVSVFERDGAYQLYCEELEPAGLGALYLAFEQLKEKLYAQGLFDEEHKKPIPRLPRKIGVVTSSTGAALQDILNILKRRYPIGTVVVFPALVQGENAPDSIVSAIRQASGRKDIDVLIVGRGGGSIEDLWAFNDERTAYAVYQCDIPVISAVGHEVDFTICDFVADLRAPTPSAAAELCAPDMQSLYQELDALALSLQNSVISVWKNGYDRLKEDFAKLTRLSPEMRIFAVTEELNAKEKQRDLLMGHILEEKTNSLKKAAASLEALSPLKVLTRGYSITYMGDRAIHSVTELTGAETLTTRLSDGTVTSHVTEIEKETRKNG